MLKGKVLLISAALLRGGNWDNDLNAGVFALNANNAPSNWNSNNGFRSAPLAVSKAVATALKAGVSIFKEIVRVL